MQQDRLGRRRASGALTAADIYAAVDSMTADEQLAEAEAFVRAAEPNDPFADPELLAESGFQVADLLKGEEVHLRCYVAMIRARDRLVSLDEPCGAVIHESGIVMPRGGQPECYKFDGLVCPEHMVTCLNDDCFYCGGCGEGHANCQCDPKERDRRYATARLIVM